MRGRPLGFACLLFCELLPILTTLLTLPLHERLDTNVLSVFSRSFRLPLLAHLFLSAEPRPVFLTAPFAQPLVFFLSCKRDVALPTQRQNSGDGWPLPSATCHLSAAKCICMHLSADVWMQMYVSRKATQQPATKQSFRPLSFSRRVFSLLIR